MRAPAPRGPRCPSRRELGTGTAPAREAFAQNVPEPPIMQRSQPGASGIVLQLNGQ